MRGENQRREGAQRSGDRGAVIGRFGWRGVVWRSASRVGGTPEMQAERASGPGEEGDDKKKDAPRPSLGGGDTIESSRSSEEDDFQRDAAEAHKAVKQAGPWDAACERKEGAIGVHRAGEDLAAAPMSGNGWGGRSA